MIEICFKWSQGWRKEDVLKEILLNFTSGADVQQRTGCMGLEIRREAQGRDTDLMIISGVEIC